MTTYQKHLGSVLVGSYVWLLTISSGMILLDIVYANLVPGARAAFSAVSDFLLFAGFFSLLAAMLAIAFSWKSKTARNLMIASLFVFLLEFLIPMFFSRWIQSLPGINIGPWLRLLPGALASILALIGLYQYARQK